MSIRRLHAVARSRRTLALFSASIVAATAACTDLSTSPDPTAVVQAGANAQVFVPTGPIIACPDTLFKANFNTDPVNGAPGKPAVGSWKLNESAGLIRVRSSLGWPVSLYKPVELSQFASVTGGVDLTGTVACVTAPSTGIFTARWRSLVSSTFATLGGVTIRDNQSRVLAGLRYTPNGVLTFNGLPVPGIWWTAHVVDSFRVDVNLGTHMASLYVNNTLKLANVPFYQSTASNVWRISLELGGTSAQSVAWDDIMIVRVP